MRKFLPIIVIPIISVAAACGVYIWQSNRLAKLDSKHSGLNGAVAKLHSQYDAARVAGIINTSGWKQYCDPYTQLCINYPADWTIDSGLNDLGDGDEETYATLTNPQKTATVNYLRPLIKDSGVMSDHIVDVSDIEAAGTKLKIVGSYPVASGSYSSGYYAINSNSETAKSLVAGGIGLGIVNPRFDIGQQYDRHHSSIVLRGGHSSAFTTKAQAEAWFKSVEGKTVRAILESLSYQ